MASASYRSDQLTSSFMNLKVPLTLDSQIFTLKPRLLLSICHCWHPWIKLHCYWETASSTTPQLQLHRNFICMSGHTGAFKSTAIPHLFYFQYFMHSTIIHLFSYPYYHPKSAFCAPGTTTLWCKEDGRLTSPKLNDYIWWNANPNPKSCRSWNQLMGLQHRMFL